MTKPDEANLTWIKNEYNSDFYECPVCHHEAYWDADYGQQLFDFCPYCGQKLREFDTYKYE